jgi:hypothetical protein
MKNFETFREEIANVAGSGQVSGLGQEPPASKKAQKIHRRKTLGATADAPPMKESTDTFAGNIVFKVTPEEFDKCHLGRSKNERWKKKLNMDEMERCDIRSYHHKNPSKSIIIQNERTGEMSYLVRGPSPIV